VDSTVDVVSLALIIIGSIELYLLRKRAPYPVSKNWHYWLKLVRCIGEYGWLYVILDGYGD
jgi:hypothetical protein